MKRFRKLVCLILGHRYYVIEKFDESVRHVGCRRCGAEWGMNDRVQAFVPWDDELAELGAELKAIHARYRDA